DDVAGEEQLEAPGHCGGVRRADHRHRDLASDQPAEARHVPRVVVRLEVAAGEVPQVHAGAEGAVPGAGEHEGADLRIRFRVHDGRADAPDQCAVQGVTRLGPVEAGNEDVAPAFAYQFLGHRPYSVVSASSVAAFMVFTMIGPN